MHGEEKKKWPFSLAMTGDLEVNEKPPPDIA